MGWDSILFSSCLMGALGAGLSLATPAPAQRGTPGAGLRAVLLTGWRRLLLSATLITGIFSYFILKLPSALDLHKILG